MEEPWPDLRDQRAAYLRMFDGLSLPGAANDLATPALRPKSQIRDHPAQGIAHDEVAFPILNAAEIHVAEKFGRRERLEAGRVLFEPGQQLVELFVILDGSLELIDTSGDQERILAVHGARGFVGEISLLTGRRVTSSPLSSEANG